MERKTGFVIAFSNPRGEPFTLGAVTELRFEGRRLYSVPGGHVATHADHRWVLEEGGTFSRLEFAHANQYHFEAHDGQRSRTFGPYAAFSSVDGVAYADYRIIAFCDDQNDDWYSYELGAHWKAIVVTPVSEPGS